MGIGLRGFLTQFWEVAITPPHWLSPVAVVLAVVGAGYLLLQRRGLLLAILTFLFVAFVPVFQDLRRDELLSGRYFLTALPVFHIASGFGLLALLWVFREKRSQRYAWLISLSLVAAGTIASVMPAYETRFTFQDEYDFLDHQLGKLDESCTVAQIQVRSHEVERDLDCCLFSPMTPLVIAYPENRFISVSEPSTLNPLIESEECVLYYESAACAIDRERAAAGGIVEGYEWIDSLCKDILDEVDWVTIAEAEVSARSTNGFFGDVEPRVRLLRLSRHPGAD